MVAEAGCLPCACLGEMINRRHRQRWDAVTWERRRHGRSIWTRTPGYRQKNPRQTSLRQTPPLWQNSLVYAIPYLKIFIHDKWSSLDLRNNKKNNNFKKLREKSTSDNINIKRLGVFDFCLDLEMSKRHYFQSWIQIKMSVYQYLFCPPALLRICLKQKKTCNRLSTACVNVLTIQDLSLRGYSHRRIIQMQMVIALLWQRWRHRGINVTVEPCCPSSVAQASLRVRCLA